MAPYYETSVTRVNKTEVMMRALGLDGLWMLTHGDPRETGKSRWSCSLLLVEPVLWGNLPSANCFRIESDGRELYVFPEIESRSGHGTKLAADDVGTTLRVGKRHENGRLVTSVKANTTFWGLKSPCFAEVLALRPGADRFTDFSEAEFATDGGIVVVPKFEYGRAGKILVFPYKAITQPGFAAAWDIAYRS